MTADLPLAEQRRRSIAEWELAIAELRKQAIRDGRAKPTPEEVAELIGELRGGWK